MISTKPCRDKTPYESRDKARHVLDTIRKSPMTSLEYLRKSGKLPNRVYKCDSCGQWHLTSKEKE